MEGGGKRGTVGTADTHQSAPGTQHFANPLLGLLGVGKTGEADGRRRRRRRRQRPCPLSEGRLLQPWVAPETPPPTRAASSAGRDWRGPGAEGARQGVGQAGLRGRSQDCASPVGGGLRAAEAGGSGLLPGPAPSLWTLRPSFTRGFPGGEAASGPGCLPGGKEQKPLPATRRGDWRKGPSWSAGRFALRNVSCPRDTPRDPSRSGGQSQSRERRGACPALSGSRSGPRAPALQRPPSGGRPPAAEPEPGR